MPKLNDPSQICQRSVNFCQSEEISPNLVTLVVTDPKLNPAAARKIHTHILSKYTSFVAQTCAKYKTTNWWFFPYTLNHAKPCLGSLKYVKQNLEAVLSSVWPDGYIFFIWPLTTMKICPTASFCLSKTKINKKRPGMAQILERKK